ncbi:MAG TPA: c-type cytochrome [Verrucomicrobia bacterium]|nr:c-type cytochrome [Verrucomicrobiota bacterium]
MRTSLFSLNLLLVIITVLALEDGNARVHVSGIDSSKLKDPLKGRILIEEMNCVSCHNEPVIAKSSKKSPRLLAVGNRLNPDYIRDFLLSPQKVKPGTLMPAMLKHFSIKEREQIANAITHYLVSLNKQDPFKITVPDSVAAEQGEGLFHKVGCVACHSPRDANGKEIMKAKSVPLGPLENKYSHNGLTEFLRRPHTSRPSGRMPDMQLPQQDIEKISHYLLRKIKVPGNLAYMTWRGKVWEGLDGDVQKETAGQTGNFNLESIGKVHHQTAIKYSGFFNVTESGIYTFHLELNGGSLSLGGKKLFSENPSNRRGTKKFKISAKLDAGPSELKLVYFHTGRAPKFILEVEGPGLNKGPIPSKMLTVYNHLIKITKALEPDPALVASGKEHFEKLGCANCHDDLKGKINSYPEMTKLRPGNGCLGEDKNVPRYDLNEDQKKMIISALPKNAVPSLNDKEKIQKTLVQFNCLACHDRTGLGGIDPDRNKYFTGSKPELGNQGRIPPPLTHVGAKLTNSWLTEVIMHGGRQRNYLNTRMPSFREKEVESLVELFGKNDSLEEMSYPKVTNIEESKNAGYEMIGATGLSCIACHDFNGQRSGGAGALELIHVTKRLKKNWFHLYMRNPSRFHPTVIMPSYWPGGQAIRKEILNGKSDLQIEALWNYLSDGERAKNPKGLSRQSLTLKVADETVMCRGRGTAGYRGIGVGYPERISLAFDSEQMALRQIWKGEFAHINHGSFHSRGNERIQFPDGIPFHRLASMDDAWPYKGKTDYLFPQNHGYQYKGYYLNSGKRPTFMYEYGSIKVEDFFKDHLDDNGKAFFTRTVTFSTTVKQEPFFFRLGSGKEIKHNGKSWNIDRLSLSLHEDMKTLIREGDSKDLLLPMHLNKGKTIIKIDYKW